VEEGRGVEVKISAAKGGKGFTDVGAIKKKKKRVGMDVR